MKWLKVGATYQRVPEDFSGNYDGIAAGDIVAWRKDAAALRAQGLDRAGIGGASCPTCYRQIQAREYDVPKLDRRRKIDIWCRCADAERPSFRDIYRAHGFSAPEDAPSLGREAVV